MNCLDCLYCNHCGTDDQLFISKDNRVCGSFVGLDFENEYLIINEGIVDVIERIYYDLVMTEIEFEDDEFEIDYVWDEMSFRRFDGDWWDEEESEWEKFLREGDLWVDTN
jgi:hypothetical protein